MEWKTTEEGSEGGLGEAKATRKGRYGTKVFFTTSEWEDLQTYHATGIPVAWSIGDVRFKG